MDATTQGHGKEVKAMGLTAEPCLDFFWPNVCKELGLKLEETTHHDRLVFISTLPEAEWLAKQGQRVCGSRWRTLFVAETYRQPFESRITFLLMVHNKRTQTKTKDSNGFPLEPQQLEKTTKQLFQEEC